MTALVIRVRGHIHTSGNYLAGHAGQTTGISPELLAEGKEEEKNWRSITTLANECPRRLRMIDSQDVTSKLKKAWKLLDTRKLNGRRRWPH